ncbi:MAG: OmpA family protein [Elusimicrobia bacterium]|nr:OmpA family protein [Elusimicrobiota bacterium]
MKSIKEITLTALSLALMGLALTGCPKKGPAPEAAAPEEKTEVAPVDEAMPATPSVDVGTDWSTAPGVLDTINFDYMKADLTPEARASLKKNAAVLKTIRKTASGVKIRVEGHCDDRGTLEYNMALGQRRANAVRDYYATLGVAKAALSTISYGEERPVCTEASDDCWARNRRGETTLKAATAVQVPLSK